MTTSPVEKKCHQILVIEHTINDISLSKFLQLFVQSSQALKFVIEQDDVLWCDLENEFAVV